MQTIAKPKSDELATLLSESREMLEEAKNYLSKDGKRYELHDWITIAEYCKRFNIPNTQTVSNWIKRGIISAENTVVIEEYNNIRLIKAIPYHDQN
ncbi:MULTISPECIES: hypothetical protein [Dyadobacter]|uniref:Helix-turn-helix domain-containing protein n=1 Tax=Dyadobacter chenhuakuii TaxID=2909339 RepID=A0ABY4XS13_9BACT|nr:MULTISPECIES: hypothetical protein [Dyadobacter]MCE7070507.1 hypothetical protein [Dyadobacter sp. CY327]MCF2492804.1 hypothetical protein [Dyadobacter chenhuakuii]USJ32906.1 hypothetical protein NFI80_09180 [Dyadobacter chenhuakuii]